MTESTYREAAERMKEDAFQIGCNLSVLVEDIYDEQFWRYIIENVKPNLRDKIDFPNPSPKGTRGKDILEKYSNFVDKNLIICVDSDCEYLYKGNVWYIREYIYHTVVHSRENFQCDHLVLNEICKDLTGKKYNFKRLFEEISGRISLIFYIWLYFKENHPDFSERLIDNRVFENILSLENVEFNDIGEENILFQEIGDRVKNILQNIENDGAIGEYYFAHILDEEIPKIQQILIEKHSMIREDTLSFFYGHGVFNFTRNLMLKVIEILKKLRIEEVQRDLSRAEEQILSETIRRIERNAGQDIETKLNDGFKYLVSGTTENRPMEEIKAKLRRELSE